MMRFHGSAVVEHFKPITGFSGLYQLSDAGNVRRGGGGARGQA
jgi:hypothetical protein